MAAQQIVVVEELSEEEQWRREHEAMHAKHRGHDVMHAEMFIIFIIALVVAQVILVAWKKRHFKSYQLATMLGMWIIPLIVALQRSWWRFLFTWLLFTAVSAYIWKLATQPHISGRTPRFIYKWFTLLHILSYVLGVLGYLVLMFTLMGAHHIFGIKANSAMDAGIYLLFYGLYYGVLGRDLAHICTDRMACKIGYFTHEGLPKKVLENGVCAVCGDKIRPGEGDSQYDAAEEKIYTLSCNHAFHEFCIRGWCVVGKQQTCPYCKEKVDLKRMFKNPWEKPHLFYGQLLDWVRYLVAWQPLIVTVVQSINRVLGLE